MKLSRTVVLALCCSVACGQDRKQEKGKEQEPVSTGLKLGDTPTAFECLNITGPDAGKTLCLVCKNLERPVAMVFARETSEPLASLLKQFDAAVARDRTDKLASFAVFLGDTNDETERELKEWALKHKISENVPFALLEGPTGPEKYQLDKDAAVTVLLYKENKVVHAFAFRGDELKERQVKQVVAAVSAIKPGRRQLLLKKLNDAKKD